jgi:uncharacterized repeat protein (TIGR03803 family)
MIDLNRSRNPATRPRPSCLFALLLLAGLLAASAQAGVIVTTLHSFSAATNGKTPTAALVQGSDGNFYGTTGSGGLYNYGTVFKISTNGVLTSLYSFAGGNDGRDPNGLVQGSDGNFYGTTYQGGLHNYGTVFKISSNGVFTSLYSFGEIPYDGSYPEAALVQGSDGNLYGTTSENGSEGNGTVFQISTNGSYSTLWSFYWDWGGGSYAPLVQGSDGNLYVLLPGVYNDYPAMVLQISTNGVWNVWYVFGNESVKFSCGLMQGSDGNFYGTAFTPDDWDSAGFVFQLSTNRVFTTLYSFPHEFFGICGLAQGSDGGLYGTTLSGGDTNLNDSDGYGIVFQISTNGVLNTLYSFTNGNDGEFPYGVLVQGSDGSFYGTTEDGGTNNLGTVFQITTNGALTSLYSFPGGYDGAYPQAVLSQGSDGNFYGTTSSFLPGFSSYGNGTVFKISGNGAYTNLYSFTGGSDGENPTAGLVQGSDGSFYGTTEAGGSTNHNYQTGTSGFGTVFNISINGVETVLYAFTGGIDGADPNGLVQGSDGNFYGTTSSGGNTNLNDGDGYGAVFQISTNGALTSLYSFTGTTDGAIPYAGLAQGSDGSFYGTTWQGGINNWGTVFKISPAGALTTLYSFTDGNDGANPYAGLVRGGDGNFYGTTEGGGTNHAGTVFKISSNGALTSLYSFPTGFTQRHGPYYIAHPATRLVQGSDGDFYGTTYGGGSTKYNLGSGIVGFGTVFQISTNGVFTSLYSFQGNDGEYPRAGLVQGSDGSFYGTTSQGGGGGYGTVFRMTLVPEFQAATLTSGTLSLTWSTEAGSTYQVQCSSDLNSGNWTNLGGPVTATAATLNTTDSVTNAPQRFYRLVLSP